MDKEKVSDLLEGMKETLAELCKLVDGEKKEISSIEELREKANKKPADDAEEE